MAKKKAVKKTARTLAAKGTRKALNPSPGKSRKAARKPSTTANEPAASSGGYHPVLEAIEALEGRVRNLASTEDTTRRALRARTLKFLDRVRLLIEEECPAPGPDKTNDFNMLL